MKNISLVLSAVLIGGFVSAQSIIGVMPDTALQNESITMSVTGSNTDFTQASQMVFLESNSGIIPSTNVQVFSNTHIAADFNFSTSDAPGFYDVVVINTYNFSYVDLPGGFELKSLSGGGTQALTNITPGSAVIGDTVVLTISGSNTTFTTDDVNFLILEDGFSFIEPENVVVVDDETLFAEFIFTEDLLPGYYDLIYFSDTTWTSTPLFLYGEFELLPGSTEAEIADVTPNTGFKGETIALTVTGANVDFTQGTETPFNGLFNGNDVIYPDTVIVIDPVTIEATYTFTEDHESGNYDYTIYMPALSVPLEKRDAFTLSKPSSVEQVSAKTSPLNIYPNPSTNGRFILDGEINGEFDVTVIDMNGRVITRARITENRTDLDLSKESAGTYLLILQNGKTRFTERLVISGN